MWRAGRAIANTDSVSACVLVQLNEIQVIITLKMHQVKCVLEGKMPPDLSHTIVFTTSGLKRLRARIDELKDEKEELRKNQKQLRREHVQLSKSRKVKEAKLKELEARARDVQVPCLFCLCPLAPSLSMRVLGDVSGMRCRGCV